MATAAGFPSTSSSISSVAKQQSPPVLAIVSKTCRLCLKKFDEKENNDRACAFHPESFSGETAQRWMAPGETEGGSVVHNFYSCCGNRERESPGCCFTRHKTFDEQGDDWGRRPGMGIGGEEKAN